MASEVVNILEFMDHLRKEGLVIVHRSQLLTDKDVERKELLKRKELTLTEIVRAELFPGIKDSETLRRWCLEGKMKGWRRSGNRYMVLTSELKRMVYGE